MTIIDPKKRPPHQIAEEIFYKVESQSAALGTLSDLMLAAGADSITPEMVDGIARLLEIVGYSMYEAAMAGVHVCQPPPAVAEPT